MKVLNLDKKKIYDYQQNREPYLMIDAATEVLPGISSNGYKDFKEGEWFFKVHWKNDPNVPGMLQIESLVQMAALSILCLPGNKGKVVYLTSANNIKFQKKIVPNTRMLIKTKTKSFKRGIALCTGEGFVDNSIACKADFNLILPGEIKKYTIRN
jgi:3-hydroxyacyl-[acyl-carrier-protein] dehydratase